MSLLGRAAGGLRALVRRSSVEQELDEELRQFYEAAAEEHMRRGCSSQDAGRAARARFGSLESVKDAVRDVGWESRLEGARRDVCHALRTLRAAPVFAAVAIVTLGLSIGANTAIFSVVNGLLLRPLPVREPDRLVVLVNDRGRSGASEAAWLQMRGQSALFDSVMAWSSTQFNLGGTEAEWVDGIVASGSFFSTLGVQALHGRVFSEADDRPGGGRERPVAVIGFDMWQRRFAGAPDAIGRTLHINRVAFTIVGVTPSGFFGPAVGRTFEVIVPLADYPLLVPPHVIANNWLSLMARRKTGQTLEQAAAALDAARGAAVDAARATGAGAEMPQLTVRPARTGYSQVRREYARPLVTVMAVVGLVLLIACANVTTLLLARASARQQELGARLALGASRARLVQQLLIEAAVITSLGAVLGVAIAWWGGHLLVRQLSGEAVLTTGRIMFGSANLSVDLSPDWRVFGFVTASVTAATLVSGLVPAICGSALPPIDVLKERRARHTAQPRTRAAAGLTRSLLVWQVALAMVLVVAAGLLGRTFSQLSTVRLGYQPEHVLVVDIASNGTAGKAAPDLQIYERVLERVRALDGVQQASISNVPPFNGIGLGVEAPGGPQWIAGALISPGWFQTFGTALVAGRDFAPGDRTGTPRVAVVNQAFVRAFFGGAGAVGRTLTIANDTQGPSVEIVGVVEDLASSSLREPPPPALYVPMAQVDQGVGADLLHTSLEEQGLSLAVRSEGASPWRLAAAIADSIRNVDPELTLTFRLPAGEVDALLTRERVVATLVGFFGVLALSLAAIGLYGVTACTASQRQAELGIRLALGAERGAILTLVLGHALATTGAGIALGIIGAAALTRYLDALLWGVTPLDTVTFITAPLVFGVVTVLAAVVPAWRAARVDFVNALR